MNLLQYIKQNYDKFTEGEKLIADYILKMKDKIVDMSAKEIGEEANTSAPTVVRFAKKLGFNSLNEMKINLSISVNNEKENEGFNYLDNDLSTGSIISGITASFQSIIEQTASLLKEEELEKAINLLINAKNIYIFCIGSSNLVGLDFYYKLTRINKRCITNQDTHLQVTSSVLMEDGDVALAISYSGETKEVLLCVENAKKNNIPVIAITKASVDNSLANNSDIVLSVPYVERALREGAMSSRISQLAIIDMLFIGMTREDIKNVEEKLVITREAVKGLQK